MNNKNEIEKIIEIIENHSEMTVSHEETKEGSCELELQFYSQAGEDCHEHIRFNGKAYDFIEKLEELRENYPEIAKEDAVLWISLDTDRGQPGPFELVDDARDKIKKMENWTTLITTAIEEEIRTGNLTGRPEDEVLKIDGVVIAVIHHPR